MNANKFVGPTREQSLKKILAYAKNPKTRFASGYYTNGSGDYCAVGTLFSKEQIRDIISRRLNDSNIQELAYMLSGTDKTRIGKKNIEAVTGLSLQELKVIQRANDCCISNEARKESVKEAVMALLKKGKKK